MHLKQVGSYVLKPLKGVDYFVEYYNLVERVWLNKDRKLLRVLKLLNTITALKCVHFLYLSLGCNAGPLANALNFDAFFLVIGKAQINLMIFAASIMLLYFNQQLYIVSGNYTQLKVLYPVIVQDGWRHFFIKPKIHNQNVCARTRKCFLIVLNLFISVLGTFEIIIVVAYVYYIWIFIVNYHQMTSLAAALRWIIVFHLSVLSCCFFFIDLAHSLALNFSSTVGLLMMFYLKLQQVIDILCNRVIKRETFSPVYYFRFRRSFKECLQFFFAINQFHGKLFCVSLVAYVPNNLLLTMWLIQGKLDVVSRLFVYFWIGYVCNLMFVFHCIFAQCTKHIHAPSNLLYQTIVKRPTVPIRTRVHIATAIYAFSTPNRYGFTYGVFGLVSLSTFAKFLILYGKFCLISYKLMQKRIIE